MLNKRITYFVLGATFVIALFLRLYQLSYFPVGFHIDEASLGYNGYSLLTTGKDENNNRLPLYIDMFGDNRPSGYHYLTILPIALFGLTEFAVRLPGALLGSITIFVMFFLTFAIFKDTKVSLLGSFLLAIAPWHIVLSRASAEAIVALFFILLGFSFVLWSLQNQKVSHLIWGTVLLSISLFFYHTPRVFVPLLFLIIALVLVSSWVKAKHNQYRQAFISSFLFLSILAMLLVFIVSGGTGRFSQVNIFGFPETKLVMEEQIREDGVAGSSVIMTRFFHNKVINYALTYVSNYSAYFTGDFLFLKGGLPIWYNVPNMGLIYLVLLPFILVGLFSLAISKSSTHRLPVLWLMLGPVVAAVTVDDIPNIQRAIVMFPMIEIIAAYGCIKVISNLRSHALLAVVSVSSLLLILNFLYFLHQYFVHAKLHRTWFRNNGVAEMLKTVTVTSDGYDSIIITKATGGMYPLVLFYTKFDPVEYQRLGSPKDKDFSGFGKFFFVPMDCPSLNRDDRFPKVKKTIYIDRGTCSLPTLEHKTIYREDGSKAFQIVYE